MSFLKFLCDNCKAKYQIADEKVAGKTVRMKCRKCGHQIEVRAAVTEVSVSSFLPEGSVEPPRPAPKSTLATSLAAQKPRAPHTSPPAGAASPLAGAFQRSVEGAPATTPIGVGGSIEVSVTDEWYVAINGVPVGPVRISELRRKAGGGAVTEDSLCWQEGLEEWRPVRTFPELAAIVREAAQQNRVSLVGPPPGERPSALPPRPPSPSRPARGNTNTAAMAPMSPRLSEPPRPPPPARSNVVPLHAARAATAERLDDLAALSMEPSPPFAPPAPFAPPPPTMLADPFAVPPALAPAPVATASLLPPGYGPPQRARIPLWFWPILVLFGGFGVGGAIYVFRPQPPQQVVVQVPVQTAPTQAAKAEDVPLPGSATAGTADPAAPATSGKIASSGHAAGHASESAPSPKGGGLDIKGLGLLDGTGGPAGGPGGGPSGASGGGLDSASVQRVVRDRQAGVKRTCWERGGSDQKSSANISVSVNVAANGTVSSASASGDDPVIAKCIENQVRTWSFPAPGSPTTVNIPFHFVRQ